MDYFSFRIKKKYVAGLVLVLVAAAVVLTSYWASRYIRRGAVFLWHNKDLAADILIASIAHQKAGAPVEIEADYSRDASFPIWDMQTNSEWLADYTNAIVPLLVYEKISVGNGVYPQAVLFVPYPGAWSFHISGSMIPMYGVVMLNERHVLDSFWNDQRDTLITLTHELIHAQGGVFIAGWYSKLEAHTSAATFEALAAMCNLGDPLACKAFWKDIEFTARNDLRARLAAMGNDDLYRQIASVLWQDDVETVYTEKKARYWSAHYTEFVEVLYKYDTVPWREMLIPGVLAPKTWFMDTELTYDNYRVGMPFDDAAILLGWVKSLMKIVVME